MSWFRFFRFVWETSIDAIGLGASGYDQARKLWKGQPAPLREPAQPLSHRDVEHQQVQIRTATSGGKLTILPPPRKPRIER